MFTANQSIYLSLRVVLYLRYRVQLYNFMCMFPNYIPVFRRSLFFSFMIKLLRESEATSMRLGEQAKVLKDEIRRSVLQNIERVTKFDETRVCCLIRLSNISMLFCQETRAV